MPSLRDCKLLSTAEHFSKPGVLPGTRSIQDSTPAATALPPAPVAPRCQAPACQPRSLVSPALSSTRLESPAGPCPPPLPGFPHASSYLGCLLSSHLPLSSLEPYLWGASQLQLVLSSVNQTKMQWSLSTLQLVHWCGPSGSRPGRRSLLAVGTSSGPRSNPPPHMSAPWAYGSSEVLTHPLPNTPQRGNSPFLIPTTFYIYFFKNKKTSFFLFLTRLNLCFRSTIFYPKPLGLQNSKFSRF